MIQTIPDRYDNNVMERNLLKMRKTTFLALVALFVAATGVIIAFAAYFKKRADYLYDDDDFLFDDPDDLEYYTSDIGDLDDEDDLEEEGASGGESAFKQQ